MRTVLAILLVIVLTGCAGQSGGLTEAGSQIQVFNEEPKIDYEAIESFDTTARGENAMHALERTLNRAAELNADGLIVHSIVNRGPIAGLGDNFGTGGGDGVIVFQIRATAIRYLNGAMPENATTEPNR